MPRTTRPALRRATVAGWAAVSADFAAAWPGGAAVGASAAWDANQSKRAAPVTAVPKSPTRFFTTVLLRPPYRQPPTNGPGRPGLDAVMIAGALTPRIIAGEHSRGDKTRDFLTPKGEGVRRG